MITNILKISLCFVILSHHSFGFSQKKQSDQVVQANKIPSFSGLAEKALKATVNVEAVQSVSQKSPVVFGNIPGMGGQSPFEGMFKEFFDQFEQQRPRQVQAAGAGFIIEADDKTALFVTNYHVVKDAQRIKVSVGESAEVNGKLISYDERNDIALVEFNVAELPENLRKVPVLTFGDSDQTKVGDWVMAIGNPFWLGNSVSVGIVSQKRMIPLQTQSDYEYIQHTAPINMGNSGGCLLNMDGEVIGVNRAIISNSGGNIGIGFAIPAKVVRYTIEQLKKHGRLKRSQLGVRVQNLTKDMMESLGLKGSGVIVGSVVKGGASDGILEPGDVIYSYDGKEIGAKSQLPKLVNETEIGKTVKIKVWRRKKGEQNFGSVTLEVKLAELDSKDSDAENKEDDPSEKKQKVLNALDMQFIEIPENVREVVSEQHKDFEGGVMVKSVDKDAPLQDFPLRRGDVIAEANLQSIKTLADFKTIIDKAGTDGREHILVLVYRGDAILYMPVKLVKEKSPHYHDHDDETKAEPQPQTSKDAHPDEKLPNKTEKASSSKAQPKADNTKDDAAQ